MSQAPDLPEPRRKRRWLAPAIVVGTLLVLLVIGLL